MAYTTLAEVRELDALEDASVYTDAILTDAILLAEARIDDETGTSWTYKSHTVTLDGSRRAWIYVEIPFVRSITSCTIDGSAETVTGWVGTDDGYVRRPTGIFPYTVPGRNVVLTFTAGATSTPPDDVAWVARTLARWYSLQALSRVPSNALQTTSEYGTTTYVQPGGPHQNPTALPEVNRILRRRSHRPPAAF